ncbi:hypothetical protein ANCDUO_27527 [Ancylostoma duodenale]|uniref:Uncharacterized protein n=1 Tax=Ancylostoma duodenale TaxID=51022 RepID=A0A0C2BFH3_9BILA|nr:hypothetical protein ANCDUO_27527 [Ancylostoma duodenale]
MSTFFPTEVLSSKIPLPSLALTLPKEPRSQSMRDFLEVRCTDLWLVPEKYALKLPRLRSKRRKRRRRDVRHDESNTRGGSLTLPQDPERSVDPTRTRPNLFIVDRLR